MARPVLFAGDMVALLAAKPAVAGVVLVASGARALGGPDALWRLVPDVNTESWRLERRIAEDWQAITGYDRLSASPTPVQGLNREAPVTILSGGRQDLLIDIRGGLPRTPRDLTLALPHTTVPDEPLPRVLLGASTLVMTPGGAREITGLAPGDLITTRDNGAVPLHRLVTLTPPADLRFVAIEAAAFGAALPLGHLTISMESGLVVRSDIVRQVFGKPEVLVPARLVAALPGVTTWEAPAICYGIEFEQRQIIFANGIEVESLGSTAGLLMQRAPGHRGRRVLRLHARSGLPLTGPAAPNSSATAAE